LLLALQLNDPTLIKRATKKTRRFNRILKKKLRAIEKDIDIEIATYDVFKRLRRVIANSESFGFNYTSEPCFYRSTLTFHVDCNFGQNANQFLFFDEIDPTAKGHMIIGSGLLEAVEELVDKEDEEFDVELEHVTAAQYPPPARYLLPLFYSFNNLAWLGYSCGRYSNAKDNFGLQLTEIYNMKGSDMWQYRHSATRPTMLHLRNY
jgi:hypothetical protein